jgi:hypothetical protein
LQEVRKNHQDQAGISRPFDGNEFIFAFDLVGVIDQGTWFVVTDFNANLLQYLGDLFSNSSARDQARTLAAIVPLLRRWH